MRRVYIREKIYYNMRQGTTIKKENAWALLPSVFLIGLLLFALNDPLTKAAYEYPEYWPTYLPPAREYIMLLLFLVLMSMIGSFVFDLVYAITSLAALISFAFFFITVVAWPSEPLQVGVRKVAFFLTGILIVYSPSIIAILLESLRLIQKERKRSRKIRLEIEKYSSIMESWRREGYDVSGLKKILEDERMRYMHAKETSDFSKIESAFKEYESKILRLKALEAELNSSLPQQAPSA